MTMNNKEVLETAMEIDPAVGEYIAASIIENVSFDRLEQMAALKGEIIPISRRGFYRERRKLLQMIHNQQS